MARQKGIAIITGVEMFVQQGARQFEIFTGKPAPEEEMFRVVLHALRQQTADAAEAAPKAASPKPDAAKPVAKVTTPKPAAKSVAKPAAKKAAKPAAKGKK